MIQALGNGWELKAIDDTELTDPGLQFVINGEVMANVIPEEIGTPYDAVENTQVMHFTADWMVVYPSDASAVDSDARNLTFLYKGFPQTLIMPITGDGTGRPSIPGTSLDFGDLWSLVGDSVDSVSFLYRETQSTNFFPQVIIGAQPSEE